MFSCSSALIGSAVIALVLPAPIAPLAPPRATIGHYNGNAGINTPLWDLANGDVPPAVVALVPPLPAVFGPTVGNADNAKAVINQPWGPILNIGTCAGGPGAAIIRLRSTPINGPNVTLLGPCLSQVLIGGVQFGQIVTAHNGVICNVPNQLVPPGALGSTWAAQAVVRGASTAGTAAIELSSTIYGVVGLGF